MNDVDNLIDKLVDVGNLPLSIVVVGVGPADFRLMVRNVSSMLRFVRSYFYRILITEIIKKPAISK